MHVKKHGTGERYYSSSSTSSNYSTREEDSWHWNTCIGTRYDILKSSFDFELNTNRVQIKHVETSLSYANDALKGVGICVTISAVSKYNNHLNNTEWSLPKVWRTALLDSDSYGYLLFIMRTESKNISHEKKNTANTWQTSNGAFKTTNDGILELMLPEIYESKIVSVYPDIVIVDKLKV